MWLVKYKIMRVEGRQYTVDTVLHCGDKRTYPRSWEESMLIAHVLNPIWIDPINYEIDQYENVDYVL